VSRALPSGLAEELAAWRAAGLERRLERGAGVDFTSNDYLGLRRDPRLAEAAAEAARRFGVGAGAARLLDGATPAHEEAERVAAEWLDAEAALLLPSGYQANLAVLCALLGEGDALFSDALNHASIVDGARLTRAARVVVPHRDLDALDAALAEHEAARRRIVVVEEVYSMDGDRADLAALCELCARRDAWLVVDRAHAAGLYELAPEVRDHERLLAQVVTGGKALGVAGAFVAGPREVVHWVVQRGRAFVFTTAPPPPVAAALAAAIRIVRAEPERAARAHALAERLRAQLRAGGLTVGGEAPIVPVVLGDTARAMQVAEAVRAAGYAVRGVRPPTVPEGAARLRLVVHADHAETEVDGLADAVVAAVSSREPAPRSVLGAPRPPAPARAEAEPDARPAGPESATEPVLVVGTDTGVGKTVVSALLLRALARAGHAPAYLKPVQTGDDDDAATVRALAGLDDDAVPPALVALPLAASVDQAADDAGVVVRVGEVAARVRERLAAWPERTVVVEGAGGLRVPFGPGEEQADLFAALGGRVVVVARSGLGTLNHTLLTLEALTTRGLSATDVFLVGPRHAANEATLRRIHPDLRWWPVPSWKGGATAARLEAWLDEHPLATVLAEETAAPEPGLPDAAPTSPEAPPGRRSAPTPR